MAQIDIKIQSVADLAALKRAIDEIGRAEAATKRLKNEGSGLGNLFRLGFGIGSGIELARRAIDLFKASVVDTAREAFAMSERIKDGAEALGVTRQAYQVLGQIMEDAGGKATRMSQAIEKNNRSLLEARSQTGAAAAAYRTLGLSAAALEALPVPRRMEAIIKAIMGAKDQTEAFGAAGDILGSKDLPVLLNALRALGTEGYDALADKMERAGKIMSDDTIERLDKAKKAIENFKKTLTIETGENLATLSKLSQSFKTDFVATFAALAKAGLPGVGLDPLRALLERTVPDIKAPATPDNAAASAAAVALETRLIDLKSTKLRLLEAELEFDNAQRDIHLTDEERRAAEIRFLDTKFDLLGKISTLTAGLPLGDQDPAARAAELAKLNAQRQGAGIESSNLGSPLSDARIRDQEFATFSAGQNAQGGALLSPLDGVTAGLQDFLLQAGTIGEQIASTLTSTIGAAVSGISDGIYGWVTGTQTASQAVLQFARTALKTALDSVVQIGVQQLINGNIFKSVMIATDALSNTLRVGRIAKDNAAEAATLPLKTAGAAAAGISSYGTALAFGAIAIALIAAASGGFEKGGFTSAGPSNKPAGIVHAGEWVAPQWLVKDPVYGPMVGALEAARTGQPGYARGGIVGNIFESFRDAGTFSPAAMIPDVGTSLARPDYAREASAAPASRSKSLSESPATSSGGGVSIAYFNTQQEAATWLDSRDGEKKMINWLGDRGIKGNA